MMTTRKPIISIMNLFALSTGFVLKPKRILAAFYRGCRSRNLYYLSDSLNDAQVEALRLDEITQSHLDIHPKIAYKPLRQMEFAAYLILSMIIHVAMLVAGKTLLVAERIKKAIWR